MSEEVSGHNHGGRPRKWESDAERKAVSREEKRLAEEKAARDEAFVQGELEITRRQFENTQRGSLAVGTLEERMQRSEEYLRKWAAGEIGPGSR